MSCEQCAGVKAWADQLQNEVLHLQNQEKYLLGVIKDRERTIESLERNLRECMDELRIRRAATGYLPHLDTPAES